MNKRDDDLFRLKPTPPRGRNTSSSRGFLSQVACEIGKAGGDIRRPSEGARGRGAKRGRGWAAARLIGSDIGPRQRRVVIKTRLVVLKQAGPRSVATHLRYIVREGVSREGKAAQAYGAETDVADVKAFEERGRDDRHQFRFIVAPEDGDRACTTSGASPATSCSGWSATSERASSGSQSTTGTPTTRTPMWSCAARTRRARIW